MEAETIVPGTVTATAYSRIRYFPVLKRFLVKEESGRKSGDQLNREIKQGIDICGESGQKPA